MVLEIDSGFAVIKAGKSIPIVIFVLTNPGKTVKTLTFVLCNLFLSPDKKEVNPDLADP